jgi:hypothetical protein
MFYLTEDEHVVFWKNKSLTLTLNNPVEGRLILPVLAAIAGGVVGVHGGHAFAASVRVSSGGVAAVTNISAIAQQPLVYAFRFTAGSGPGAFAANVTGGGGCAPNISAATQVQADGSSTRRSPNRLCFAPLISTTGGAGGGGNASVFVGCICSGSCEEDTETGKSCECPNWPTVGLPGDSCKGWVDTFPMLTNKRYWELALVEMATSQGVLAAPGARLGLLTEPAPYIEQADTAAMLFTIVPLMSFLGVFLLLSVPTLLGYENTCIDDWLQRS